MPLGVIRAMHEIRTGVFGRRDSNLYARLRDPRSSVGYMSTASLTSIVTDSAPASVAWATGVKTANRFLASLPNGQTLTTIMELLKGKGIGCGLVTTTRVTHATPAAWVSHQPHRDLEDNIALDLLGQTRLYLAYAAELEGQGRNEDDLMHSHGRYRLVTLPCSSSRI